MLERDAENSYLAGDLDDSDGMASLRGHSIRYRIAVGPNQGRKVFTLQTVPAQASDASESAYVAQVAGFSLHAGVAIEAHRRDKLEHLCRYMARPALAEKRLELMPNGHIRYRLKTPYRDGTTHVILEPLDFIARLAALVPRPRVNLTRYHGVLAPNSRYRAAITPGRRGQRRQPMEAGVEAMDQTPTERRAAMTWAQRLKRVFAIDIETCERCGGPVKIIACIEDPDVIEKILTHLKCQAENLPVEPARLKPQERAPPQLDLFG